MKHKRRGTFTDKERNLMLHFWPEGSSENEKDLIQDITAALKVNKGDILRAVRRGRLGTKDRVTQIVFHTQAKRNRFIATFKQWKQGKINRIGISEDKKQEQRQTNSNNHNYSYNNNTNSFHISKNRQEGNAAVLTQMLKMLLRTEMISTRQQAKHQRRRWLH